MKHKFGAKRTERYGNVYRSRLEANCVSVLEALKTRGEILFYLRETRFDLPGKIKHYVDFTVFTKDNVFFIEAKGRDLPMGKNKRSMAEDLYKIEIHVVTAPEQIYSVIQ